MLVPSLVITVLIEFLPLWLWAKDFVGSEPTDAPVRDMDERLVTATSAIPCLSISLREE
jgi:hypothetical protein